MRGTLSLAVVLAGLIAAPAAAEEVNLAGPGFVPVTVPSGVDAVSVQLAGQDPLVSSRDVSGDTVLRFDKTALGLTAATRSLPLTGRLDDGSPYRASEPVTPTVRLEVKTTDLAALRERFPAAGVEPLVTGVSPSAIASLAPPATPDFSAMQTYLRPAPVGTDADFSRADPRARGAGVRIADLEYYWTSDHEDLQLTVANDLGGAAYPQYTGFNDEHGTAVFGEMAAKDNGYGVTGGVPDASMNGISPTRRNANGSTSYVPAAALTYVAQFLSAGDAVLIEQQTVGPHGGTRYAPLEWQQSSFDAMKMLNGLGVIVIETGRNGSENLDHPDFLGRFDRSVRDSGAIIVGAGSSNTAHTSLSFSSWGSRMDLQGVGQNVTTTGSNGNLFGGNTPESRTFRYTRSFSGTSSSGPIVTNAVVAVQSYLKATGRLWTATQISDLLKSTGTPQGDPAHRVGEFPNIAAALKKIEVDAPATAASFAPDGTVTLTGDDGWGSGVDRIEYRADGGAWTTYAGPFKPAAGTHVLEHRATDKNGNVGTASSNTLAVDTPGTAGGTVPATLSLTLGGPASFGAFTPGIAKDYTASASALVTSTAGDATLSVSDPGHLMNGTFSLPQPLQVTGAPRTWSGPVSNDSFTLGFTQSIGANALRTGTYSTALTFTLSTVTP
jgi:Subtilase family